jgi:hypothetical protein
MSARIRVPDGLKTAYKAAKDAGWTFSHSGQNHIRWTSPTRAVVMTPATTRSRRGCLNDVAKLKRAGLEI